MAGKRKLSAMSPEIEEPVDPADEFMFLCLGGGMEVGRSCHIIQYKGKTVMVSLPGLVMDLCTEWLISFNLGCSWTLACILPWTELQPYLGLTSST